MKKWIGHNFKQIALLLTFAVLLTAVLSTTIAYIVTGTPTLLNIFIPGFNPSGDLTIHKTVEHPFGQSYVVPQDIRFDFAVDLGPEYAMKTVKTSQGSVIANENGCILLTIPAGGCASILELDEGTQVTVTELLSSDSPFVPREIQQSVTIPMGRAELWFRNVYQPAPAPVDNLRVAGLKLLEGRDWAEGDCFEFVLEYKNESTQGWQELGTAQVMYELIEAPDPEDPAQTILIPKPDFDRCDLTELIGKVSFDQPGTYSFRFSEIPGEIAGILYDPEIGYFDILIGDRDMDGNLEIQAVTGYRNAEISFDEAGSDYEVTLTVRNVYAPEGVAQAQIRILKNMVSYSGEAYSAAGFVFELYDEEGNLVAESAETSAAGETSILLSFGPEDVGNTYYYILKEYNDGKTAVTYDNIEYAICISVVDNLDGTISAYVYDRAVEELLDEANQETEPAQETESTQETEPAQEMEPTQETEPAQEMESVQETELVVLQDTDIPEDAAEIYQAEFRNIYNPADTTVVLEGVKILDGRAMKANEFTFQLFYTGDSFVVTEDMKPIRVTGNTAEGGFAFPVIAYDKVGVYRYVIQEDSSDPLGGMTYDDAVYYVTVTVVDDNGALRANVVITDHLGVPSEIIFHNTYKAETALALFSARKKLEGMEIREDMFGFLLYEADENFQIQGQPIQRVTNTAEGDVSFNPISFSQPGEYRYVLREDSSKPMEGMEYDARTFLVLVRVTDNGNGQLEAKVVYMHGESLLSTILFENVYNAPVEPTEPSEPTEPTKPIEPTEPSEPTEPTNPSEPTGPSESTEPTNPSEPTEPSESTEPTNPSEPTEPSTDPPETDAGSDFEEETTGPTKPPHDIPTTGDDAKLLRHALMMIMSFAGIVILLSHKRKKGGKYLK